MIEVGKKEFLSFSVRGQGSSHMVKECRNDVCCCGNPKTRLPPWEARTHKPTPPHDEAHKGFWPRGASRLTPAVGARWGASWGCQSTAFTGCLWEAEGTKWDRLFTRERERQARRRMERKRAESAERRSSRSYQSITWTRTHKGSYSFTAWPRCRASSCALHMHTQTKGFGAGVRRCSSP